MADDDPPPPQGPSPPSTSSPSSDGSGRDWMMNPLSVEADTHTPLPTFGGASSQKPRAASRLATAISSVATVASAATSSMTARRISCVDGICRLGWSGIITIVSTVFLLPQAALFLALGSAPNLLLGKSGHAILKMMRVPSFLLTISGVFVLLMILYQIGSSTCFASRVAMRHRRSYIRAESRLLLSSTASSSSEFRTVSKAAARVLGPARVASVHSSRAGKACGRCCRLTLHAWALTGPVHAKYSMWREVVILWCVAVFQLLRFERFAIEGTEGGFLWAYLITIFLHSMNAFLYTSRHASVRLGMASLVDILAALFYSYLPLLLGLVALSGWQQNEYSTSLLERPSKKVLLDNSGFIAQVQAFDRVGAFFFMGNESFVQIMVKLVALYSPFAIVHFRLISLRTYVLKNSFAQEFEVRRQSRSDLPPSRVRRATTASFFGPFAQYQYNASRRLSELAESRSGGGRASSSSDEDATNPPTDAATRSPMRLLVLPLSRRAVLIFFGTFAVLWWTATIRLAILQGAASACKANAAALKLPGAADNTTSDSDGFWRQHCYLPALPIYHDLEGAQCPCAIVAAQGLPMNESKHVMASLLLEKGSRKWMRQLLLHTSPGLGQIPAGFFEFRNLRNVIIIGSNATAVDTPEVPLKNLMTLNLMHNEIENLPETLFRFTPSLVFLLVRRNPNLRRLPESVGGCQFLTYLDCGQCAMDRLPESTGDLFLSTLIADRNRLSSLPALSRPKMAETLVVLIVHGNRFTTTSSFASLRSLLVLVVTSNQLGSDAKSLAGIGALNNLEVLDVAFNPTLRDAALRSSGILARLPDLEYLSLRQAQRATDEHTMSGGGSATASTTTTTGATSLVSLAELPKLQWFANLGNGTADPTFSCRPDLSSGTGMPLKHIVEQALMFGMMTEDSWWTRNYGRHERDLAAFFESRFLCP